MSTEPTLFATVGQVQAYVTEVFRRSSACPAFPQALDALKALGQLRPEKPPLPPFSDGMSPAEFDAFIQSLPLDATQIIAHAGIGTSEPIASMIEEVGIFPHLKDVFCFKHMPYMDETLHTHDYFELTYVYTGTCKLLFENESVTLTEGEMCIVPPLFPHNHPLEETSLVLGIVVRKSTFDAIFGQLLTQKDLVSTFFRNALSGNERSNYLTLMTERTADIERIVQMLVYEAALNDTYANSSCASLFNMLMVQLLRQYSDTIRLRRMDAYADRHGDFPLILQYIQQNFRTVTLSALAQAFHYSEAHLSKLIKRNMGQSFTAVVRGLKMARAVEYLQNTDLKIADITQLIGYDSVDHFSRTFKAAYGAAPRMYRMEAIGGGGVKAG